MEVKREEILALERKRIFQLVSESRAKAQEAMASDLWSYTMEYQLGKLDTAVKILEEVERDLG